MKETSISVAALLTLLLLSFGVILYIHEIEEANYVEVVCNARTLGEIYEGWPTSENKINYAVAILRQRRMDGGTTTYHGDCGSFATIYYEDYK